MKMNAALVTLVLAGACSHPVTLPPPGAPPVTLTYQGRDSDADDFVLPDGAPPPRAFVPFSDAEVRAQLGKRLDDGEVRFGKRHRMPFDRYFELLNAYEKFLNELGASLRDGGADGQVLLKLKPRDPKVSAGSTGGGSEPFSADAGTKVPGCMFAGSFDGSWRGAASCADQEAANDGWFGIDLCAHFDTLLRYNRGENALTMNTWQDALAAVVLFGARVDATKLHSDFDWVETKGDRGLGPQPGSGFSLRGDTQTRPNASAKIPGPQVDFLVGPKPVSVRAGATIEVHLDKVTVPSTLFGWECANPKDGSVQLTSRPKFKIVAESPSGAEEPPVRATLEGTLAIADDQLTIETDVAVRPSKNQIEFAPKWTIDYQHLVGAYYLVVDADFLIAHKRWRIELENLPGGRKGTRSYEVAPRTFATE